MEDDGAAVTMISGPVVFKSRDVVENITIDGWEIGINPDNNRIYFVNHWHGNEWYHSYGEIPLNNLISESHYFKGDGPLCACDQCAKIPGRALYCSECKEKTPYSVRKMMGLLLL